jgi:cyanophycinase
MNARRGTLAAGLFACTCAFVFAASSGPSKGSLVIVGGGKLGPEIVARFVSLAGGPDANFVVIPTAGEDRQINLPEAEKKFCERFGVRHVTVLHTRDRTVAGSADFVAPLRTATAVWFEGGRQWRLADSYLNTLTGREVKAVLDRGGVVGGSSAGATILGSYLVRGATEGAHIMMSKSHEEGLGLVKNVAIDQHLLKRHRENDLVAVIDAHPDLLGIGIDESTAIVVQGDKFQVIGESKVGIYDGQDHDGKKYFFLNAGDTYDLGRRSVHPGTNAGAFKTAP